MEHNGLRYDRALISNKTTEIIYKHLTESESKELHRIYATSVLKLIEIAPYVLDLPRLSIVRILESIISADKLQDIKIDLVTNGLEFGTVEPRMINKIRALEKELEKLTQK